MPKFSSSTVTSSLLRFLRGRSDTEGLDGASECFGLGSTGDGTDGGLAEGVGSAEPSLHRLGATTAAVVADGFVADVTVVVVVTEVAVVASSSAEDVLLFLGGNNGIGIGIGIGIGMTIGYGTITVTGGRRNLEGCWGGG